ncbi:MAG: hypothetical protein WKF34_12090, partial [Pyrinomonadaceae bacterium]
MEKGKASGSDLVYAGGTVGLPGAENEKSDRDKDGDESKHDQHFDRKTYKRHKADEGLEQGYYEA